MNLALKVKINNVSDLTNARTFAGCGVDYIGFQVQIHAQNTGVDLAKFTQIRGWVIGPAFVLETLNLPEDPIIIQQIFQDFEPDYIEANSSNVAIILNLLNPEKIIFRLNLSDAKTNHIWQNHQFHCVLFDCDCMDTNQIIALVQTLEINKTSYLLNCLPKINEIKILKNNLQNMGLCLNAISETKTGLAELETILDILETLEE